MAKYMIFFIQELAYSSDEKVTIIQCDEVKGEYWIYVRGSYEYHANYIHPS
jgi:hypothetical protein